MPQPTLTTRIHRHLINRICSGELPVGSHVNASTLAAELDVSRTTVRKAIDQLISEGCVEIDESQHPIVVQVAQATDGSTEGDFDTANQTEQTYRAIYEKVLRREYSPGDTVRAPQLTEELGVSLVTVRQALDWLSRDGIFMRIPRRGWRLALPTLTEIRDIYRCRLALEPLAIQQAIENITDDRIEELDQQCRLLLETASTMPEYERLDIDMKFHLAFVDATNSRTLIEVMTPLLRKRLTFSGEFTADHQPHTFAEEHLAVLDGIREGDANRAIKAMKAHLNRALKTYSQHLDR